MDQLAIGILTWALGSFPVTASVLMGVGILRAVNKPLFSLLHSYVLATPNPNDDKVLDAVEKSKIYTVGSYMIDWFGSVKINKP